ncbi:DNA cytosine methyltransferase [Leptospira sp. 96542]|nr:DNA cytosine methyltransferase [Leptospira sp. 96542]
MLEFKAIDEIEYARQILKLRVKMNKGLFYNLDEINFSLKEKQPLEKLSHNKAVLTHYLHNMHNGVTATFEKEAIKIIERYVKFKDSVTTTVGTSRAIEQFLFEVDNVPFPPNKKYKFTFIDLFAGIGGFKLAMQNLGGKCIFASEWDKEAQKTYLANFGEVPFGDITNSDVKSYIPKNFDILCAGFPCQAFSIAGRRGGFEDTRGTLFFEVADIIKKSKPKAIFLENVKGLISHQRGATLETILNVLRNDLNYIVPDPKIINAKDFGVPQNRERIFIVGFRKGIDISKFQYPLPLPNKKKFGDIKESRTVPTKYYLSKQYLKTLRAHRERHSKKGNGFGYEIIEENSIANAVVCGGMGRERNLVIDKRITDFRPQTNIKGEVNREGVRKMTPREWARLQGFPDNFKIPVSDASAYKQFGNSVAVPAIQATGLEILKSLGIE